MERSLEHRSRGIAFARLALVSFGAVILLTVGCAHALAAGGEGAGGEGSGGSGGSLAVTTTSTGATGGAATSSTTTTSTSSSSSPSSSSTGPGCVFPSVDCGGQCIDVSGDPYNCGACNFVCGAGQTCGHGTCFAAADAGDGGGPCDNTGDCQMCFACAVGGACTSDFAACNADADCLAEQNCVMPCNDQACVDACAMQHPTGSALFMAVINCTACVNCVNDCNGIDLVPGVPACP